MTDTRPYTLTVDGFDDGYFVVQAFRGREAISETYAFEIVVTAPAGSSDQVEQTALGQTATFVWNLPGGDGVAPRAFYCVVAAVRVHGVRGVERIPQFEIRVVPRLWLLKRKRNTRIFQNMRVPDVVTRVLAETGISTRWQLSRTYPVREYVTQYEESDLAFVKRLLAEAGILFYFPEGVPVSDLVFTIASIADKAGATAGSLVGSVAGSAAGALVTDAVSAATPIIPGDTLVGTDDAQFYPPLGASDAAALEASTLADLAPEAGAAAGLGAASTSALGAAAAVATDVIGAATAGAPPSLSFLGGFGGSATLADKITKFTLKTTTRANQGTFRDFDPDRPMTQFESVALSNSPFPDSALDAIAGAVATAGSALGDVAPGPVGSIASTVAEDAGTAASVIETLAGEHPPPLLPVYEHHADYLFPKWNVLPSDEGAKLLRQRRRRTAIATGASGVSTMCAGHTFALSDHPAAYLDGPYVVTRVDHVGRARVEQDAALVYENDFACAPASLTYAPKRPKRRSVLAMLTATVVGPKGAEIYVSPSGQIRVQFHWDRDGKLDEKSSCWIRVMQSWSGAGYGAQFIPRVGMEVVVSFDGGDPDKPLVLGCVYNGTHPTPFVLPKDMTLSGWRTQSSPGGNGANELSFDDRAGSERVVLQAQRDLEELVLHDHTAKVTNDERISVGGNRVDTIAKNLTLRVDGDGSTVVKGNRTSAVTGDEDARVSGARITRVEGRDELTVQGVAQQTHADDRTVRVLGCDTTIVGTAAKKRSWTTHAEGSASLSGVDRLELSSDTELTLKVGDSSIRITKSGVEISAASVTTTGAGGSMSVAKSGLAMKSDGAEMTMGSQVLVKTQQASMRMGSEVQVDGQKVLLNSPSQSQDTPPPPPDPPTDVAVTDQDGAPLALQRFVVTQADGTQVSGKTDKDGKATPTLSASGKIVFPDMATSGDAPQGDFQPYVVKQGDHVDKLAFAYGFDADAVWNDGKNAELKSKRKSPSVLFPGDVLQFPRAKKDGQPISKGTSNAYTVTVPKKKLTLTLKDERVQNAKYEVRGLGAPLEGSTSNGAFEIDVPVFVREIVIAFDDVPLLYNVRIGDLDPISEASGVRQRLEHLGFRRPTLGAAETDEDAAASDAEAILAFQTAQGLTATGELDGDTRSAIESAHGS